MYSSMWNTLTDTYIHMCYMLLCGGLKQSRWYGLLLHKPLSWSEDQLTWGFIYVVFLNSIWWINQEHDCIGENLWVIEIRERDQLNL